MTLLLKESGQLAIHHHLARTCQSQLPTLSSIIAAPTLLLYMTHPTLLYVLCSPNILDLISFSFRNWYKNWRQQKLKNPKRNPSRSPLHHHRKLLYHTSYLPPILSMLRGCITSTLFPYCASLEHCRGGQSRPGSAPDCQTIVLYSKIQLETVHPSINITQALFIPQHMDDVTLLQALHYVEGGERSPI